MQRTSLLIIAVCGLVLSGTGATTPCYGKSLSTSDFGGDFQAVVNAASDNDTIVVDVPSWSIETVEIARRLHILGTDAGDLETRGLRLLAGASGMSIRYLHIQPPVDRRGVGIAINGPGIDEGNVAADDIAVEYCSIVGFRIGIRGRFADGWHVYHNYISAEGGLLINNNGGIVLNAGCDDWDIHHNDITAQNKCIMLFNSAPDSMAVADVVIMHNICQSSNVGVMLRSRELGGVQNSIDIKNNDFMLTGTPVLVLAAEVFEDNRCEPDSYVLDSSSDEGVIYDLAVRKNTYPD